MQVATLSVTSSWQCVLRWWITTTWSLSEHWRRTIACCSGRTIPVRFHSLAALVVLAAAAHAQSVDTLARDYRKDPSPQSRSPLARFAAAHPNDRAGAQARLAL